MSVWPCGVAVGMAEGEVVEVELLDRLAVFEVEVGDVVGAVLGGPFAGGGLRVGGEVAVERSASTMRRVSMMKGLRSCELR